MGQSERDGSEDLLLYTSPFADASIQGAQSKKGKYNGPKTIKSKQALSYLKIFADSARQPSTTEKVNQWMGVKMQKSFHNHPNKDQRAKNHVAIIAIREKNNEDASDSSSITEACAPPSTWGSDTEADFFGVEYYVKDSQSPKCIENQRKVSSHNVVMS